MEGIAKPRRFCKSNFYGSTKTNLLLKKTEKMQIVENGEEDNIKKANPEVQSAEEIYDNDLPFLSQASTQPDIPNLLKSNIYTAEESSEEIEPCLTASPKSAKFSENNIKRVKRPEILAELQKSSIYTFEEDNESDDSPKVKKVNKKNEDTEQDELSSGGEVDIPMKRTKSLKRVYKAPLKKMNKMLDVVQDQVITGENYVFASDDEIEVEVVEKPKSNKFLEMIKSQTEKSGKLNYFFAKSVLTDKSTDDHLEVKAPQKLVGFTMRKPSLTARDTLREHLRSEIINRKTSHIMPELVFSKGSTELEGKNKKKKVKQEEEDEESEDYVPEDNEADEAMQLEKMIKLEEGFESEPEPSQDSLDTETENSDLESPIEESSSPTSEKHSEKETCGSTFCRSETKKSEPCPSTLDSSPIIQTIFPKTVKMSRFIEREAEIGSDHEEHDDLIKHAKDSDNESGLDQDLEEIIDREAVDENDEKRYEKHLKDILIEDENQIKKVINGEFRKGRKDLGFVEGSNIFNKKQQLMDDKKKILQSREKSFFSVTADEGIEIDKIDNEELEKYRALRNSQELKFIRGKFEAKKMIDEDSLSLLSLISRPESTVISKSLLSDSEKSNSIRVFQHSQSLSSNRSFVFSKEKSQKFEIGKQKPKNTKLFSLLSR